MTEQSAQTQSWAVCREQLKLWAEQLAAGPPLHTSAVQSSFKLLLRDGRLSLHNWVGRELSHGDLEDIYNLLGPCLELERICPGGATYWLLGDDGLIQALLREQARPHSPLHLNIPEPVHVHSGLSKAELTRKLLASLKEPTT